MAKTATMVKANVKTLNAVDALAASKFKLPKDARNQVQPGEYPINMTVQVVGSIKVGEDYTGKVTAALPMQKLFMAVASNLSTERLEQILRNIDKIDDKEVEEFSARIQGVWEKLAETTTKPCKGKVTSDLAFFYK